MPRILHAPLCVSSAAESMEQNVPRILCARLCRLALCAKFLMQIMRMGREVGNGPEEESMESDLVEERRISEVILQNSQSN